MPNRTNLTQLAVDRIKSPDSGRTIYWDKNQPGFGLRVAAPRPGSREGRKTWVAMGRVDGKPVMETLATLAQEPKVGKARKKARDAIAKMRAGTRPLDERRADRERREADRLAVEVVEREAAEGLFEVVAERFIAEGWRWRNKRQKPWAPNYAAEVRRLLEHDVLPHWRGRSIRSLTKHDVNELLDAKARIRERPRKGTTGGAAVQANRVLTRLRTLFAWAASQDLIDADPSAGVLARGAERARDRVLDDDEIKLFWRGCERAGWPFGPIFRLLLLTAQREGEVKGLRWSEIDLDKRTWTIPRERTKSDRAHIVHLSALAAEIIEGLPRVGDLVFRTRVGTVLSSFSKPKIRLDAAMTAQKLEVAGDGAIEPWVLHDLRRTATTIMAERLKVMPHIADKILNHSTGTIRGVAAVYNRAAYLDERKAALEALGHYVEGLVRPGGGNNVVPLAAVRR
jgi:integrase